MNKFTGSGSFSAGHEVNTPKYPNSYPYTFGFKSVQHYQTRRHTPIATATIFLLLPRGATATTPADINVKIEQLSEQAHQLQGRINKLQGHQDATQAQLNEQTAREQAITAQLTAAKAKLAKLKRELAHAKRVLSHRVVAVYKDGEPDVLNIVLSSRGFRNAPAARVFW